MPQLPPWVSYLQALAVPIIGAIIALFSVWIAARQMWIAQRKLDHDIFYMQYEKRFAVYEATRKVLANVFHGNLSDDDIRVYGLCTLDAQFLFDDDEVYKYLNKLCQRVAGWNYARLRSEQLPTGEEKDEFERITKENLHWIIQQGDEKTGFAVKFAPFLRAYKPVKRPWWLRWPV
jgi:hypothetical protein